jgi:hypothetical protein
MREQNREERERPPDEEKKTDALLCTHSVVTIESKMHMSPVFTELYRRYLFLHIYSSDRCWKCYEYGIKNVSFCILGISRSVLIVEIWAESEKIFRSILYTKWSLFEDFSIACFYGLISFNFVFVNSSTLPEQNHFYRDRNSIKIKSTLIRHLKRAVENFKTANI